MNKSLLAIGHSLSNTSYQIEVLESACVIPFKAKVSEYAKDSLCANSVEVLQINLGTMCNQVCAHCHVDAGPDRKEIMARETMEACLRILENSGISTVDLTGGAPEMNPHFRWFVAACSALGKKVIVRCNLTIIVSNPSYYDLPEFYKTHQVEVISSLPCYTAANTDKQRGDGVFEKSIKALRMLNAVGYGIEGSGFILNLVYNPGGASLPPSQQILEADYKTRLFDDFGISFNRLYTFTNMPVSRFLFTLLKENKFEAYMKTLLESFNPHAIEGVMCRNMISVGWDGYLYDCDFNQMLDIKVTSDKHQHLRDFNENALSTRIIAVNNHCYGCTAGAGSSCGGSLT